MDEWDMSVSKFEVPPNGWFKQRATRIRSSVASRNEYLRFMVELFQLFWGGWESLLFSQQFEKMGIPIFFLLLLHIPY